MKTLVLGGTTFVGPHLVDLLINRGHDVTLFNRGKTNHHLFPDLEKLLGDRNESDLAALEGRAFDAIFDVNAYVPRVVREMLDTVNCDHYVFVSTISVYDGFSEAGITEGSPTATISNPNDETVTGESYGALKILCEKEALSHERCTVIRPGLIVGPRDPTDRFTYWIARTSRGGSMLTPMPNEPVQYVDVRDVARFLVDAVEEETLGIYNLVTPPGQSSIGDVIDACERATGATPTRIPLSNETIETLGIAPWQEFPAWLPSTGEMAGMVLVSPQRALDTGWTTTPLDETVSATWDWFNARDDQTLKTGLDPERETELILAVDENG